MLRTLSANSDLHGKRVIVRCDLNVPLESGKVTDDGRIRASLPTIKKLRDSGAKVIVISHLGRPEGAPDEKYSLLPVAKRLSELLGEEVAFASDTVGASAKNKIASAQPGSVTLLENLRFNQGEASKDSSEREVFAKQLADHGDLLVSDGFGVVHRKQASVYELAKLLPSYAGELISTELKVLERLTVNPERPYTVVLGGSKVSDKLGVIENLLPKVNKLLIGGGMVFTFLAAMGYKVGKSLLEQDQIEKVKGFVSRAKELGVELVLPKDIVVADKFAADARFETVPSSGIEASSFGQDAVGLDIGPIASSEFAQAILISRTVFWNGPMGVFEFESFANGTRGVARALSETKGFSVVGGGDSAAAVRKLGFSENAFDHISTGGGASLEFLEGKSLPGLEVLND
ncbi:MAG: phosphoglycerate kinase [Aquiluna sp.]